MLGLLIGFSYLPKNDAEDFSELNIYFFIIVFHFKFYQMPIPNKKTGEKQNEYMIRCVPQLMKYHNKSQAIAICYKEFKKK